MMNSGVAPLLELSRGDIVESTHFGSLAIVDARGRLLYSAGDPTRIVFLRSAAKPFQALPFHEQDGPAAFGLSLEEQALLCASHEGSDEHVRAVESLQDRTGVHEMDLQCGAHMPADARAYRALLVAGTMPTPNRNNCSGKHTGMLALAKLLDLPPETYLEIEHPIQQEILRALSEMSDHPMESIRIGIDGCSAPNFALPLRNAALAYARLCDPQAGGARRQRAARAITRAMVSHPEMVSGPTEFDCRLMRVTNGKVVCKRGAEGYQAVGIMPGALSATSVGIGIALKVSDGDPSMRGIDLEPRNRVRPAVILETLRQIGALTSTELEQLAEFGPTLPVRNNRGTVVGISSAVFSLKAESLEISSGG